MKPLPGLAAHLAPGQVKPACDLKLARSSRGSIYDPIAEQIRTLKLGDALVLNLPEGAEPRAAMNRLNAALVRYTFKVPAGCKIVKRLTEKRNQIAVMLVRVVK
jgi:hypothetical protein